MRLSVHCQNFGRSVESVGVFINNLAGTNNGSDGPAITSITVLAGQVLYASHNPETAPWILS